MSWVLYITPALFQRQERKAPPTKIPRCPYPISPCRRNWLQRNWRANKRPRRDPSELSLQGNHSPQGPSQKREGRIKNPKFLSSRLCQSKMEMMSLKRLWINLNRSVDLVCKEILVTWKNHENSVCVCVCVYVSMCVCVCVCVCVCD